MTAGGPPAGLESLHRLAAEAERMRRSLRAPADPDAAYEGHDETGAVHAVVDAGGTVTDVRLEHEWYEKVDARRLGAAVLQAVEAAEAVRASARDEEADEPPLPFEPVDVDPSPDMLDRVRDLVRRLRADLEKAEQAAAVERAHRKPVKAASGPGHVTVVMDGDRPVEVRIETDTRWIGTANHLEIAGELRDAFAAAYRSVPAGDGGGLAELRSLLADPDEFVARLFGKRS